MQKQKLWSMCILILIFIMISVSGYAQRSTGGRKSTKTAPSPSTYQLSVRATVSNYQVIIDGQTIRGTTATVQAGQHNVTVRANGYEEWRQSVNVNGNRTINATLQPLQPVRHRLSINSNVGGAYVYIDGSRVGTTPFSGSYEAGSYSVRVSSSGYQDWSRNVNINSNQSLNAQLQQEASSTGEGMPVTFYWHAADTADIYINGRPIKVFNPNYEVRGDEAPLEPFELRGTIKEGDIITVGTRRGGSYGFMMVAVNNGGQVVMKTDRNWKWYDPYDGNVWFQPQAFQRSNNRQTVGVNPNPWGNQNDLVREYGSDVKSIYSPNSGDRTAHLYYKVSFSDASGSNSSSRGNSGSSASNNGGAYERLQLGETVTVDMRPGSQTEFKYEFIADQSGNYELTAYQQSGGFFDDSNAVIFDQRGNQIASPSASQVGNGFSMNLSSGTYRVHITHMGGPATGMTRVEARR